MSSNPIVKALTLYLPLMRSKKNKILLSLIFMAVFTLKMAISVAPLFLSLNNKTVNTVITQLELDGKTEKSNAEKDNTEKDNAEKDLLKDKKFFDEYLAHTAVAAIILTQTNVLHNQEHSLYVQLYHPVVPTPPPSL